MRTGRRPWVVDGGRATGTYDTERISGKYGTPSSIIVSLPATKSFELV